MSTEIVVTGHEGRLGSALLRRGLTPLGCDIGDREAVREALARLQPRTIINCAAWSDVDGAEEAENEDAVIRANVRGVGVLRTAFDGFFIHLSSGYIFDGKAGPYDETAPPYPISFYGWSKLGGEAAAMVRFPTLIVRTLDLFGLGTHTDFVRQIRDMLELGQPYPLPANLYGSPTFVPHLADGILSAEERGLTGILNITGDKVLSRLAWGKMIASAFGYDPDLILPTDEIKGAAPRPLRGGLTIDKARSLDIPIHAPEEGLQILAEQDNGDT